MLAYINDEYEDEMGQPLPLDPKIAELCEKYNLTAQEPVSFKDVPGGIDNFEAWAFKHHVPGNHAVQVVNRKCYLDLYVLQQELPTDTAESSQDEPLPQETEQEDVDEEDKFEEDQGLLDLNDFSNPLAGDEQAMTESAAVKNSQPEDVPLPEPEPEDQNVEDLPENEEVEEELDYKTVVEDVNPDENEKVTFDAKAFFDDLPEPQQVGVLHVTRKLKKTNDHAVKIDDVSSDLMKISLRHLIHDPLAGQLLDTIGYSELSMSYLMYMATATQQIKQIYWKQWCVAKIVARIINAPSAKQKFEAHHSIRDIIEDNKPETKVADGVRWFMLLSTIRPQADVVSNETRTERKLDQLQNELWLVTALSTAMLASEDIDTEYWPELLSGQRAKALRTKVTQLRNDLIKPYQTIKRTEAAKRRGK
jgi:hypothetical protein